MDDRLFQDEQGWWFAMRGGDRAGPFPDQASAHAALARFRRRCDARFALRPSLAGLPGIASLADHLRGRRSA